ncbi:MAG TPA: hypothetical protein VNV43_11600 [Candidatus Acidoferrales bacterium]|nr:hypothetical protein [Candidatus Acidoferrales bacterium]
MPKKSFFAVIILFLIVTALTARGTQDVENFEMLRLASGTLAEQQLRPTNIIDRYGVPFIEQVLPLQSRGSAEVQVGSRVDRIFLLGMTDAKKASTKSVVPAAASQGTVPLYGWADPRDTARRAMIGDEIGCIRLNYANGTSQDYPLILGESVWYGQAFYDYQGPYATDAALRRAFARALRLYPPEPVQDGNYLAVIKSKAVPLRSITIENSPEKNGTVVITGITVELEIGDRRSELGDNLPSSISHLPFSASISHLPTAISHLKPLLPAGQDEPNEKKAQRQLENLKQELYSSDESFKGPVPLAIPSGYTGPIVSFGGSFYAKVLANAFYYNVEDILAKIDKGGMYHTSTKGAISWGGYCGFGTFRTNVQAYYGVAYTRDMGRSLQEITVLNFTNEAERCADWSLKMARLFETRHALEYKGVALPRHWGDLANNPRNPSFENDGQGLTTMFIYKLWQRLSDRDAWLRARWPDVQGLGDWILWQFAHPAISGATNGLLHTTGESGNGDGYAPYPDSACMNALRALADMADSIGKTNSAQAWRARANLMQDAIGRGYVIHDPTYGPVWTLDYANWSYDSSVLGPLIFSADYQGFAPQDENDDWHSIDEAAYRRLIDTFRPYQPFGFYGKAMGYGQGFVTQSALLLDRMHDATTMLDWDAKEIYDPRFNQFDHFVVSEGVQISPDGRYWYRFGDLGNGVQEGETIKTLRLVIGLDDTHPQRLQFYPRMPFDWNEVAVEKYPIVFENSNKMEMQTAFLRYTLKRTAHGHGMKLTISADHDLGNVNMRLGPFENEPTASDIHVNGRPIADAVILHSGDSWWVCFKMRIVGLMDCWINGRAALPRRHLPSPIPYPPACAKIAVAIPAKPATFGLSD